MSFRPLILVLIALFTVPAVGGTPVLASVSASDAPVAENAISISFDLARRAMNGTSRISLPPGTPLKLAGGTLALTGAVLEHSGQTPQELRPTAGNDIVLAAAESARVVYVSWTLTVPENGAGDNLIEEEGITLAGLWHPLPDIDMVYQLEALLPANFTAISEAETMAQCPDGKGENLFSSSFTHPLRSIHFVAGPYAIKERTLANGVILASLFFQEDSGLAEEYLDQAAAYMQRYEELIGPYPYPRYSIVENRLPTGYGMPTFTLLGQAVVRLPFIKDTSLGHEILHSWFGNSVRVKEEGGNWCEGLTTYLADHLYAEERGEGGQYRKEQLQRYGAYVPGDNSLALIAFTNASDRQPMARHVRAVGYDKGSMFFHMLRLRLGDEQFFAGLRRFYETMRFKQAGWDDIEENFTAAAGEELRPFFDQWLTRTDMIKFLIDKVDVSQGEGRSVITFTVEQKSIEPYDFDLPVLVSTRTGDSRHTVRVNERSKEVKIIVDDLPTAMALDPDYDLMRDLRPEEEAPTWSRFMGAGSRTVVLPPADREATYAPLLALLQEMGCETVTPDGLKSEALAKGSFIFLGSSAQSLALFADPAHAASGFTVDVRKNPLAPGQVMALITSSSPEETAAVVRKLSHYGKYSFLYFSRGQIQEKRVASTVQGLRLELFQGPAGVRVPDIRSFEEIIGELRQSRVVYVGETHTDMGVHILQLQILQALFQDNPDLAVGMEMFPRSAQEALDGYISGAIATEQEFLKKSGYFTVWGFDYRLYREIIGYAKRHSIPLVGLNIDKTAVNQVFRDGNLEGLDDRQREQVPAERNLDIPGYRERLALAFAGHEGQGFSGDKLTGFVQAQALWDEAMAETIADYLRDHPGRRMLVIAGNGHVFKDTGIPPRVARRLEVPQSVVSSISYGNTGKETGYRMDYLLYTSALELTPAPKVGVVLEVEGGEEDPAQGRVRVKQISPHGKAGEAGLQEKDIILAVDQLPVHDINDIKIALLDKHPGDKAGLKVLREHDLLPDKELELTVELTAPTDMEGMGAMPSQHPKK
ncbi:MAG: ChaN family lipoprotein [Desulfobulbaceae bacterium]